MTKVIERDWNRHAFVDDEPTNYIVPNVETVGRFVALLKQNESADGETIMSVLKLV